MKRTKSWDNAPSYESKQVRAGVLETAVYPDGIPVAQVGFWNEYGTRIADPRPFMRSTIDQNQTKWLEIFAKLLPAQGTTKALDILGADMSGAITQSILTFSEPVNAPYTVAKKGFNKPLVDQGILSRSISWEVQKYES